MAATKAAIVSRVLLLILAGSGIAKAMSMPRSVPNVSTHSLQGLNSTKEMSDSKYPAIYDARLWASYDGDDELEEDIPNIDYFAFTLANINASKVADFYGRWTVDRQKDPAWNETSEWKAFAIDFTGTRK